VAGRLGAGLAQRRARRDRRALPVEPADYIVPTLTEEESAECEFGEPIVEDDRAAIEWSAETRLKDGDTERLAGVSLLRFDSDGLVTEQRDFWAGA
jgi:hypothetical protein